MEVFRIHNTKYPIELSGIGAAECGGRWNSKGVEIIYCAGNRSLAMAEVAVHILPGKLPKGYIILRIDIPDEIIVETLDESSLNADWNTFPHKRSTQVIGDSFIQKGQNCVLAVPSAVVEGEYNYLINPNHKDFSKIKILDYKPFKFNDRFFK